MRTDKNETSQNFLCSATIWDFEAPLASLSQALLRERVENPTQTGSLRVQQKATLNSNKSISKKQILPEQKKQNKLLYLNCSWVYSSTGGPEALSNTIA